MTSQTADAELVDVGERLRAIRRLRRATLKTVAERAELCEHEVLLLIARGLTTQEIGDQMALSANTVKSHTRSLFTKLAAHNRVQALSAARERGLIGSQ